MPLPSPFSQNDFDVRFDWGLEGLRNLTSGNTQNDQADQNGRVDAVIVVDVLLFGTALDIAVSRNASIFPARHGDPDNERRAASLNSLLANADSFVGGSYTLSPSSLLEITPGQKLLLPSPNGAALCLQASGIPVHTAISVHDPKPTSIPTFCACLRNARSVARAAQSLGSNLVVIAAGDTWPGGALRPALEDLWGAGAIIHYLKGTLSPEAQAAACSFESFSRAALHLLRRSAAGRELAEQGFGEDIELAAALNESSSAPFLQNERFVKYENRSEHLEASEFSKEISLAGA